jgi:hypothetical protein
LQKRVRAELGVDAEHDLKVFVRTALALGLAARRLLPRSRGTMMVARTGNE